MTPEELKGFVFAGNVEGLVKAVESLSEKERSKLSKEAVKLNRYFSNSSFVFSDPDVKSQKDVAEIAILACCPFSSVRRIDPIRIAQKEITKVLCDRKPSWINDWIEEKLNGEWISLPLNMVRKLMKEGICEKPKTDRYINLIIRDLPPEWFSDEEDIIYLSDLLLADHDLLEDDIWRIFEVESLCFEDIKKLAKGYAREYRSWAIALKTLSVSGHLDRWRLLTSSLDALNTGFKKNTISGFMDFHDFMEPTPDELDLLQKHYLSLLSNRNPSVVSFVLKKLKLIDKNKKLDDQAFVESVGPVFDLPSKAQPKDTLIILKKVIKRSPELGKQILKTICSGLNHETPDIQELVLEFMGDHKDIIDKDICSMISEKSPEVSPSNKALVDNLLADNQKAVTESNEVSEVDSKTSFSEKRQELLKRIDRLSSQYKKYTGLDYAVKSLDNLQLLPPMSFEITDVPVLSGLKEIKPIENVDELLDSVAHALEVAVSPIEFNRILDGISRLCDQKSDNFEGRIEILLCRVENADPLINDVVKSWLTKEMLSDSEPGIFQSYGMNPMKDRLDEISKRWAKGKTAPLLSAPTHEWGWIDISVLIDRIFYYQQNNIEFPKYDFIQAILKISPGENEGAYEQCKKMDGLPGKILRWYLNGDKSSIEKSEIPFWIAAGRAKFPRNSLEDLLDPELCDWGPDCLKPAEYPWKTEIEKNYNKWSNSSSYIRRFHLTTEPNLYKIIPKDFLDFDPGTAHSNIFSMLYQFNKKETCIFDWIMYPTLALHNKLSYWNGARMFFLMFSMIWKHNTDPYFAAGIEKLVERIENTSSISDPNYIFLEPLLETDRPISELGYVILIIGLAGKDTDTKGYAIDALVEGIQDGRIDPDEFSQVLAKLGKDDWIRLNRIWKIFLEISKLSPLHSLIIAEIIEKWLENQEELPPKSHDALSLLLELQTELGLSITDKVKNLLVKVKGSTKSAKLAKNLLKHSPEKPTTVFEEALLMQIESRVERVERWENIEN